MGQPVLTLTPAAITRAKELLAKNPAAIGLRVGVTVKGCSGFVHQLGYAETEQAEDIKLVQKGVRLFIDPAALPIVEGSTVDFVSEDLEQRFVFNNPNAKGNCGCGESFSV